MDLQWLRRLVRQGEGQHLEFKRKLHHPDKIAKEMVAFANTEGGGILLIGVDDDGTIYGIKNAEGIAYTFEAFLKAHCRPPLPYQLHYISVDAKRNVLVFDVAEGKRKPYFSLEEDRKLAHVRVKDMSVKASKELVKLLRYHNRPKGVNFEYGDPERKLLQYLEEAPSATLEEVQKLLALPRRITSAKLITLVRAGLLHLQPTERGDRFSLVEEAFQR
ncbi:MAG: ATP-binding protein [Bacteroidota bacterium]